MRALSIKEPWISIIADGRKSIETRTWHTLYRGELLLCGCKRPTGRFSGLMACIVNLVDCRAMTLADTEFAQCDYYDGYSWVLEDVRLVKPAPVIGQQGIYWIDDGLIEAYSIDHIGQSQLMLDLIQKGE